VFPCAGSPELQVRFPTNGFQICKLEGPYTFWHHIHEFYESKGGTVIRDNVAYKLPGWVPGDILAHAYVKKDLEKIFIFRRQQIEKLFIQDPKSSVGLVSSKH
jgi:ligand-binding SRPBCC domain-containing protein